MKDENLKYIFRAGHTWGPQRFIYSEGGTGFGVRLLAHYIRDRIASS